MWQTHRYLIVALAALAMDLAALPTRGLTADEAVSLETIRAAIRDHVSSVTSISTKYRLYYKYGPIPAYRDVFGGKSWGPQEHEWAEQGPQKLLKSETASFEDGSLAMRSSWVSYDGTTGYNVGFDSDDPSRIRSIGETPELDRTQYGFVTPAEFAGLRVWQSDETLPDLLAASEARADGVEVIEGSACWRVDVGTFHTWSTRDLMHLHVVFDPAHGYLPRRIKIRVSPKHPEREQMLKQGMMEMDLEVVDYQRVRDLVQGTDRWFPRECRMHAHLGDYRYVIDEVLLNASLPVDKFRPQPQQGTEIFQGRWKVGEPVKSYIFGGPAAVDAVIEKRIEEAKQLRYSVSPGEKLLDARDQGSIFSFRLLFWCSLGLIAVIGVWQVARRMQSP